MSKVVVGSTMSLDGFIAGPNDGPGNPLGDGGSGLFDWWTAGTERLFAGLEDHPLALQCTRVVESDGVTRLRYRYP